MSLATAQPVNAEIGVLLVNEFVDELVIGKLTLELTLLLNDSVGEDIDEFVSKAIVLEVKLEVVVANEDEVSLKVVVANEDEVSLELKATGSLSRLVMDKEALELELLRRLKDVELTDVLDMG
jgi:hypothetical protein